MFNRNHVLHRDSSSGVPELLSGPIDTRRGKSAEGISHSSGDPLWRGATIRTAIESTGLTIRGNANIFLPFSFAFSFSLLTESSLCSLRERSCRIEPLSFAFLVFSKFLRDLFFLRFVFYFQVVAKIYV